MYALDIIWDPSNEGINIFGKFTIHYYSLMWIAAFTIGHFVMKKIYQKESLSEESLDSLFMYTILGTICLLYTSPSPRDRTRSRMPSSA